MSDEVRTESTEGFEGTYVSEVEISPENMERLRGFLSSEIQSILDDTERAEAKANWDEWRRQRVARTKQTVKNTPWPNASNVAVPETMAATDAMYAKIKTFLNAHKPMVSGSSPNAAFKKISEVAAEVLNYLNQSVHHVHMAAREQELIYDWVSMGTQVLEWEWVDRRVRIRRGGNWVEKVIRRGPNLVRYRLEDVLVRLAGPKDVQNMAWVGFRKRFYGHEMMSLSVRGFFDPDAVEDVLAGGAMTSAPDDNVEAEDARMGLTPQYESSEQVGSLFEVVKAYVWWDADEDGHAEDLIVWVHQDTGTILRMEYNPIGVRLITIGRFREIPEQWYGVGIGWKAQYMQEEIDTFHNLRVDTQHLSSMAVVIEAQGAQQLNNGEALRPGARFKAVDPKNDYQVFRFPDVTGSTLNGEMVAQQQLQKAIGVNDGFMGNPNTIAKSGTSYSLEAFQANRSDSIFQSIAQAFVVAYNDMFQKELMLLIANGPATLEMLDGLYDPAKDIEKYEALRSLLQWDPEDVPTRITFQVKTTDMEKTEDSKRQSIMLKLQAYTMVIERLMQFVPMMQSPQLDPDTQRLMANAIVGYNDMLKEAMELLGSSNVEDGVMDVELFRVIGGMLDERSAMMAQAIRGQNARNEALGAVAGAGGGAGGSLDGADSAGSAGAGYPSGATGPGGPATPFAGSDPGTGGGLA